jgi:RNA recognition motif-containing protein
MHKLIRRLQAIRNEGVFQLDSITNLLQSSPQSSGRRNQPKSQRAQEYLKEYERDRNSVFVGNLPQDFTEAKVRGVFEHYGAIVKIAIHQRPSQRNRKFIPRIFSLTMSNRSHSWSVVLILFR